MAVLLLPLGFVVCWSSGFVGATMAARAGAPAEATLLWRYVVTAALLVSVTVLRRRRPGLAALVREAVIGLLAQGLYLAGVFHGAASGVPTGTGALVASLQPVLVAVLATRLTGERLTRARVGGLAAGVVGVGLVAAEDLGAGGGPTGLALVAGGMLALTAGTLLADRWPRSRGTDLVDSLTVQAAVALALFVGLAVAAGETGLPRDPGFWQAIALLVAVAFLGGYGCYSLLLERSGPTGASRLLLLTPGVSAAWGWAAFGESVGPLALVGFGVALAGVVAIGDGSRGGPNEDAS